jgi:ABC-type lipoprotein export system ATPase subunit
LLTELCREQGSSIVVVTHDARISDLGDRSGLMRRLASALVFVRPARGRGHSPFAAGTPS